MRLGLMQVGILLLCAVVPATASGFIHPRPPIWSVDTVPDGAVSLQTIQSWGAQPQWIDARSAQDFRAGHVPGALPLSLSEWDRGIQAVLEAWTPGRPVVVYCDERACQEGRHVADALRRNYGLDQVWTLHGGWSAWLSHSRR